MDDAAAVAAQHLVARKPTTAVRNADMSSRDHFCKEMHLLAAALCFPVLLLSQLAKWLSVTELLAYYAMIADLGKAAAE